jgi:hypothetical protein
MRCIVRLAPLCLLLDLPVPFLTIILQLPDKITEAGHNIVDAPEERITEKAQEAFLALRSSKNILFVGWSAKQTRGNIQF